MKTYKFKSECRPVVSFKPLTDTQWANVKDLIDKTYTTGGPRKANLRNVVDGIRYLVRTGCQWRNIDTKYEKMSVLRYYFDLWTKNNTWSKILQSLVLLRRVQLGCEAEPNLGGC